MNNILRVLVPVDFSKESELAVEWAQRVVKEKAGATIYLLHVFSDLPHGGIANVGYSMELDSIKHRMKTLQDRLPKDLVSVPLYEAGHIPQVIARACEAKNMDLVIMTTRGRRGLTRILHDSTTEETVRLTPCPVLVLHLNEKTSKLAHKEAAL